MLCIMLFLLDMCSLIRAFGNLSRFHDVQNMDLTFPAICINCEYVRFAQRNEPLARRHNANRRSPYGNGTAFLCDGVVLRTTPGAAVGRKTELLCRQANGCANFECRYVLQNRDFPNDRQLEM